MMDLLVRVLKSVTPMHSQPAGAENHSVKKNFSVLLATFLLGKLFGLTGPLYQEGPMKMALEVPASGVVPPTTHWLVD